MIVGFYGWLAGVRGRWETMPAGEQWSAAWNGFVDALLAAAFGFFVWNGLTRDSYAFAFWVPFLGVVLFLRYGQMKRRWTS